MRAHIISLTLVFLFFSSSIYAIQKDMRLFKKDATLLWDFSNNKTLHLWHKSIKAHCKNIMSKNTLKLHLRGKDTYIYIPQKDMEKLKRIKPAERKYIIMKAKCTRNGSFLHQIYWATNNSSKMNEKNRINYIDRLDNREKIIDDDGYSVIVFDMSQNNKWMNEIITNLRFDVYNDDKTIGQTAEIKWIIITGVLPEKFKKIISDSKRL